jgi:hypothetical protein
MVGEEIVDIIAYIGKIGLWLQALGAIVILWIIFQIISWMYNRRRMKEIYSIKKDINRIEKKIDKILNKR